MNGFNRKLQAYAFVIVFREYSRCCSTPSANFRLANCARARFHLNVVFFSSKSTVSTRSASRGTTTGVNPEFNGLEKIFRTM